MLWGTGTRAVLDRIALGELSVVVNRWTATTLLPPLLISYATNTPTTTELPGRTATIS